MMWSLGKLFKTCLKANVYFQQERIFVKRKEFWGTWKRLYIQNMIAKT